MAGRRSFAYQAVIAVVAVGLALPVEEARAGGGDALAGGIIGFAAGMMVGRATARPAPRRVYVRERPARPARPVAPKAAAVSRADVVLMQKSLTMLGYYTGPIDGSMGPGVRAAVVKLQDRVGWPATGVLTADQRVMVIQAYKDALASRGGATVAASGGAADQLFASISRATALAGQTGTPILAAAAPAAAVAVPVALTAAPALATPAVAVTPAIPAIGQAAPVSSAPNCLGASPAISTPLSEWCGTRAAAVVAAAEALKALPTADASSLFDSCGRTAASLAPNVAALQSSPAAATAAGLKAGYDTLPAARRAEAASGFKVCVGVGLSHDDGAIALASALAATGLGEQGFAEYVAGSLALGYGAARNDAAAADWYGYAADGFDRGVAPLAAGAAPAARASVNRALAASLKAPATVTVASVDLALLPKPAVVVEAALAPNARGDAEAFFVAQQLSAASQMDQLSAALGMSREQVASDCEMRSSAAQPTSKGAADLMTARLCRAWAYSTGRKPAMYRFDKVLADSGDADAQGRLPKHVALGNDRI